MNRRNLIGVGIAALLAAGRAFAGEFKRQGVIPGAVARRFGMQPARGGAFTVLGEDGESYSIDETFRAIFEMLRPHWQGK